MTAARQVRHALAEALGVTPMPEASTATVNVEGAAALLHTTVRAVYVRRSRGQMPTPLSRKPLVWRTADVLAMKE